MRRLRCRDTCSRSAVRCSPAVSCSPSRSRPLFAGLYPLTQLYQMEEDRRRGDRTLALLLGLRASLGVAIACTALAFALFGWAAVVLGVRAWLLVLPLVAWALTDLVVLLVFAR